MKLHIWFSAGALALVTAGCSGGSSALSPASQPTETPAPSTTATPAPTAAPTATATPAVAPTATPAATPTAAPTATPAPPVSSVASISFASNAPVTFTVTQANDTSAFTESDTCSPQSGTIATIVANATPATASYEVTPIGPGTCAITVTGIAGSSVTIPVSVSAAAITVQ